MTCIVGLVHQGDVWLGADSAGADAWWNIWTRADAKLFSTTEGWFLVGFTTSFRMGQILRYRFKPPEHPWGMAAEEYLSTLFVDEVRNCLGAYGWRKKEGEREEGGAFLVGYQGLLASVGPNFAVGFSADGVDACGCGGEAARGAMLALARACPDMPPGVRIRAALAVAEQCSAGVRGPFLVRHLCEEEEPQP